MPNLVAGKIANLLLDEGDGAKSPCLYTADGAEVSTLTDEWQKV